MIDWAKIEQELITGALDGLMAAGEEMLARAKHYAPVRSIFKGRKRGPAFSRAFKTIRSEARFRAFTESLQKSHRFFALPLNPDLGEAIGRPKATTLSGHQGSLIPVLQRRNTLLTGDLRRYRNGRLAQVDLITQRRGVAEYAQLREVGERGRRGESAIVESERRIRLTEAERAAGGTRYFPRRYSPESARGSANAFLTSRGRYEVGRARSGTPGVNPFTKEHFVLPGLYQGRVGGRLRGELRLTPVEAHGTGMYIYVESPTPYAVYQEYGTSHNRPQPFLRPALYEMRTGGLRRAVQRGIGGRIASGSFAMGGTAHAGLMTAGGR